MSAHLACNRNASMDFSQWWPWWVNQIAAMAAKTQGNMTAAPISTSFPCHSPILQSIGEEQLGFWMWLALHGNTAALGHKKRRSTVRNFENGDQPGLGLGRTTIRFWQKDFSSLFVYIFAHLLPSFTMFWRMYACEPWILRVKAPLPCNNVGTPPSEHLSWSQDKPSSWKRCSGIFLFEESRGVLLNKWPGRSNALPQLPDCLPGRP